MEKKWAVVKASVTIFIIDGEDSRKATFEGHGDATQENIKGDIIKPHFLRMAETRAIARALRWATNNATTADEEK